MRAAIDARTLIVAGVAVAVVAAYWGAVSLSRDYYLVDSPAGSVFSTDADGAGVLFSYLEALDVDVDTLQGFDELPTGGGTIVVVAPAPLEKSPTPAEVARLGRWVEEGGRLVLAGIWARDVFETHAPAMRSATAPEALVPLTLPSAYAEGVARVQIGTERLLTEDSGYATHLKDAYGQVVVSRAVGAGEVVWVASAVPLANEGIGLADNARFATLLVATAQPVYFDEYHHGFVRGGGVWDRLGGGGRAAAVMAALALALALSAAARRPGPAIEPLPERTVRRGAYIGALAELYRRAGARAAALRTLEDALRSALVRRFGTEAAGRAAAPAAAHALDASAALRARDDIARRTFMEGARTLVRARREVEGLDG